MREGSARVASCSSRKDKLLLPHVPPDRGAGHHGDDVKDLPLNLLGSAARLPPVGIHPFGLPLGENAALLLIQAMIQIVHQRTAGHGEQLAMPNVRNVKIRRTHQVGIAEPLPLQVGRPMDWRGWQLAKLVLGDEPTALVAQVQRLRPHVSRPLDHT